MNQSVMSFDSGEGLVEKISPFDTLRSLWMGMLKLLLTANPINWLPAKELLYRHTIQVV